MTVEEVLAVLPDQGFERIEITDAHLTELQRLPIHHRDPFDHLLIAQAVAEGAFFLSEDQHAPQYTVPIEKCSD